MLLCQLRGIGSRPRSRPAPPDARSKCAYPSYHLMLPSRPKIAATYTMFDSPYDRPKDIECPSGDGTRVTLRPTPSVRFGQPNLTSNELGRAAIPAHRMLCVGLIPVFVPLLPWAMEGR